jgi:hypothetical protein
MNEMFKMAGMELPEYLGKETKKDASAETAEVKEEPLAEEVKA